MSARGARSPRLRRALALAVLLAGAAAVRGAYAADRAIEDIRFAKQGGVVTVEVVFACPIAYLSHAADAPTELRVRVELSRDCLEEIGGGMRSELHDPPSKNLAGLQRVVFDTREGHNGVVALRLARAQDAVVSQGRARNTVRVELRPAEADSAITAAPPSRPPDSAPAPRAEPAAPRSAPPVEQDQSAPREAAPPAERRPIRLVQRPAERGERFVIQLAAREDAATAAVPALRDDAEIVYANDVAAGSRRWQELRLGFFASEQQARERMAELRAEFPDAVVAVASVAEQDRAAAEPLSPSAYAAEPANAAPDSGGPALAPERVAALAAEANDALLAGNYDRGIQIYTRLAEEPGYAGRQEARERLGVARERKGQVAQAKREYEAYLVEFPTGADAQRVRQRLAGLVATVNVPREPLAAAAEPESLWEFAGGIAQYYRRDDFQPLEALPATRTQSALFSNIDLAVRRHGERFEVMSRVNAGYQYNLLDETESSAPADQLYVTNAYVEVADERRDWSARVGRQAVYGGGVLGRFDGAHAEYRFRPDIVLNLNLGRPIDYPRHAVDTHRQFAGVSADLDKLLGNWDFSFFAVTQEVDGIADRQAGGVEARFRSNAWSVVTALDADLSYGVLNSALVMANWRVADKLTLNGRFNSGAGPFLTTRNALMGQSAVSIEALLDTYTEAEIRRIARNRTAQLQSGSLGLSRPLFDRFQLNADLTVYELGATVASADVPAIPASGQQTSFYLSFVGSSVLKDGDTTIFSLRHSTTRTATGDTLLFDFRLPTAGRLRLNPRLALTSRTYEADGSRQTFAAPGLRLAYRWPRRHQLEVEVGAQLGSRVFPAAMGEAEQDSSESFVNAGYWWEF
jgi:hypothetical protein